MSSHLAECKENGRWNLTHKLECESKLGKSNWISIAGKTFSIKNAGIYVQTCFVVARSAGTAHFDRKQRNLARKLRSNYKRSF